MNLGIALGWAFFFFDGTNFFYVYTPSDILLEHGGGIFSRGETIVCVPSRIHTCATGEDFCPFTARTRKRKTGP